MAEESPEETLSWTDKCMNKRLSSVEELLCSKLPSDSGSGANANENCRGKRLFIFTESEVSTSRENSGSFQYQALPLNVFNSESGMSNYIRTFYEDTSCTGRKLLLLVWRSSDDPRIIQLAQYLINEHHTSFMNRDAGLPLTRHAAIVICVDRRRELHRNRSVLWHLSFSLAWEQYLIDNSGRQGTLARLNCTPQPRSPRSALFR